MNQRRFPQTPSFSTPINQTKEMTPLNLLAQPKIVSVKNKPKDSWANHIGRKNERKVVHKVITEEKEAMILRDSPGLHSEQQSLIEQTP